VRVKLTVQKEVRHHRFLHACQYSG
jgi:hypothetical protein